MQNNFTITRQLFHIAENNGFSEDEILVYKNVCGTIPQVLFDYYQQLGRGEFNQIQDNLLIPSHLRLSKNGEFLIFYQENQLACVWAIKVQDFIQDNPPVYISYDETLPTQSWKVESNTLIDFFNTMAHLQAIFGLPYYCEDFFSISEEEFNFIRSNFTKKPFGLKHWTNAEFYGNKVDEVIYIDKNDTEILMTYASFDERQFDNLEEILGSLGK